MMYTLSRLVASVARFWPSCGFGIQSPFAFGFVKDVVRDRGRHEGYAALEARYGRTGEAVRLRKFYHRLLGYLERKGDLGTVVIIEGIHRDGETRRLWREVIASEKVGVSFDLYDCGIVFFDTKMHKRNYKVMLV